MELIDLGLVSRLLGRALSAGGDFAEIYVQRKNGIGIELDDGNVRSSSAHTSYGLGIRVLKNAQMSYCHSDDMSEEALLACADAASRIGQGSGENVVKPLGRINRGHHADPQALPSETKIEDRLALLMRTYERAQGAHKSIEKISGSYADGDEEILIANSDGLLVTDTRALCRLNLRVIINDGDRKRVGSYGAGSRIGLSHFENIATPEAIADEALRQALAQVGARPAPVGEQTVVVANGSSGVLLHEAVGHGLEADFNRKKNSLFAGRIGEKVASELCTVVDDGTLAGQRGSLNIDDEGHKTQHNVLIEKGILKGYLQDRHNAKLMDMPATGNGRRESFRSAPMPRMTNTYLAGGQDDPEEIVRSVKKGIYCKEFGGGQVQIGNGNFTFEVREGYLIEDGKITAPIQGATLTGNGPETLKKVVRVGSDYALDSGVYTCGKAGQSVPVCVGMPTIRIDGITVGGTGS